MDDPSETRKRQRLAEKASADEQRVKGPGSSAAFLAWVPGYLDIGRMGQVGVLRMRYRTAWQAIRQFLAEQNIIYPRQVRYEHGTTYIDWRQRTPVHGYSVGRNTALLEMKFLSQLVSEAVRRDHSESNPLRELRVKRAAVRQKREFRSWHIGLCNGDKHDFLTQYVKPLRYLCGPEQLFDRLSEVEAAIDGDVYVVGLEMIGGVNYA